MYTFYEHIIQLINTRFFFAIKYKFHWKSSFLKKLVYFLPNISEVEIILTLKSLANSHSLLPLIP